MALGKRYGGETFGWALGGATIRKEKDLPIEDWKDGDTAPTETSTSTSPEVRGLLFDDVADSICLTFKVPYDYAGGDIELHLLVMHQGVEVNGDEIEWTADYIAYYGINRNIGHPGGTQTLAKTSTNIVSATPIGFAAAIVGSTAWDCKLTFTADDSDNPLHAPPSSNDLLRRPLFISAEVYRGSVGGAGKVGNVILIHAWIEYTGYVGILP